MESVMTEASQDHLRENGIGATLADLKDTAVDQIEKASALAGGAAESVTEQARDAGQKVQEAASNVDTMVRQSIKNQPMATLAVAAALGFVLGALWKSR
jgi:ElaB/YqjD/DUF883 family membrane-anchored ribosome-binding protein